MPSDVIQWYPGHMAKTRRMIEENLKNIDVMIELLDARIPYSSRNPEIGKLKASKPSIILLNKASLADPVQTAGWARLLGEDNCICIPTDCVSGNGLGRIAPAMRQLCAEKLEKYRERGMTGRKLKAMVLGIPNVGKSSLVNRLAGAGKAKVENRPGVTLNKQWIATSAGFDLLDMPGILWPKFDDRRVAENLAATGAVKDVVIDTEAVAIALCKRLRKYYPELLCARYKLAGGAADPAAISSAISELSDAQLLELIGKKRGFRISGGDINIERTVSVLLDEFRSGKIGRITLDRLSADKVTNL